MKEYRLALYEKAMPDGLTWAEKLRAGREAGFDALELSIDESDRRLSRLEWSGAQRRELLQLSRENGMYINTICLSGHRRCPLGSADSQVRQQGMQVMRQALELAYDLGVRIIQLAGYDVTYGEPSTPSTRERFLENLAQSVQMASACGVVLALETMENSFMNTVEKAMYYVDTIHSPYKVVFAPNLMLVSDADAQNLKQYVAAGGCLVVGVRAGMKNEDNVVTDQPWPGPLRELCGVTVDEFEAFPEHTWNTVEYRGKVYDARMWADVLHNETAQVQAVYHDKFYRGSPAVTRNRFGKGSAVYFGVAGCPDLIRDYLPDLLAEYGVSMIPVPGEVYVTIRESAEKKYLFLINMNRADVGVDVPFQGVDCLTGRRVGTRVLLPPLGVVLMDCSPETQE